MRRTKKAGWIRRRLMTGLFCISLFAADVTAVIPVWASEPAAEQDLGENGSGEEQTPDDGNRGGDVENPDGDSGEDKVTNPSGEGGENQTQNPDEGKDGDAAQNPDEKKDGDNAQNPDEEKDGDTAQNPEDGKETGEETETEPGKETGEETGTEPEKETGETERISLSQNSIAGETERISLSQNSITAQAASGNSLAKDSMNQYMADAFLRDSCWINNDAVQGIPEAFYYAGDLRDNPIWLNMEDLWEGIKAANGSSLDLTQRQLYLASLMDIFQEQVQLEQDLNSYSIEGDIVITLFESAQSDTDSGLIDDTNKILTGLSYVNTGAGDLELTKFAEEHLSGLNELSSGEFANVVAVSQQAVSTGSEMCEFYSKAVALNRVNDGMIAVLDDMYKNVDAAFSQDYKGTSAQKAAEKAVIQEAILEMRGLLDSDEFRANLLQQEVLMFEEGVLSSEYAVITNLLWDQLGTANPQLAAVKAGLSTGDLLANLIFNVDDKFNDAAVANVKCKLHRIINAGVKRSRQSYKSSRSAANAEMFVNYVYLLSDSYRLMLEAVRDYALSTDLINKFYLDEKKASLFAYAGAWFGFEDDSEDYKKYEQNWLSKINNETAAPVSEILHLYQQGMEHYVEQQKARKTAITNTYVGISSSESADEAAKKTAADATQWVQEFVTYPSVTAPSESEIAEAETKSRQHQFTYADQVISSDKTLGEDMLTYGSMTFSGGVLDLNGHTLTVYGDFYHTGGQIRFNKGTLVILGKYYCRRQSGVDDDGNPTYTTSSGTLRMADAVDRMQVAGDFYWNSSSNTHWTTDINSTSTNVNMLRAGTIEIGGSFRADELWLPGTLEGDSHREVFKNPEGTEVYFASTSSYFSSVSFPEKAEGKGYYPITWSGKLKGFTLQQDMYLILPESQYPEGYQTLDISGCMNLNGYTLTIPGNVMHTYGQIAFHGGKLDVRGNYEAKRFSGLDNDGKPTYATSSGTLRMADAADRMQVAGDFYWNSYSSGHWTTDINSTSTNVNMLRAGTIEIGGSFRADELWLPGTLEGDSHREVFKNPEGTEVYFASTSSYFSSVSFPEKAEGKGYYPITWSGKLKGFTLQQDMYLILPESQYPEGYQTLDISGCMNLNGHTLTIPGNVMHTYGQIAFHGGKLDVGGNYEAKRFSGLDNDGKPTYATSSGTLRMADAADRMQVAGDFYWNSYSNTHWTTDINSTSTNANMLRAGTIEIGGNFRADASWRPSTLEGDSHIVWLKGTTAKTISMPSGSRCNILKLDGNVDSYSITPNPCWAVLLAEGFYHVQPEANLSINDTVITNKADGTVTVKNTKTAPNVNITLKLPQKNTVLVVSQNGEITIPPNTELTMPGRKDRMILPEGGTANASGVVKSGCLVVGDIRIEAQENTFISVSAGGEITIPKNAILTESDGTKYKLPQGGTITEGGELTGEKIPAGDEGGEGDEGGDKDEWVAYTVTLDGMGHSDTFTKNGIRSGMLLELTENEKKPAAKEQGYMFAGWYKDKSFAKGKEWDFDTDTVQSDITLYACWLTAAGEDGNGLKLCVQEIPDLTYTGSAQKPEVTVYDSDGVTLLKAGKDYTVKYANNINAVAADEAGRPTVAGGTAKVADPGKAGEKMTDVVGHFTKDCPYVIITGKGNYTETIYRNFMILPAQIAAVSAGETAADAAGQTCGTPLAAGFTLKYTDQFEAKADKTAKIVSSFKYKKALKADRDYTVSVQDENGKEVMLTQGKLPLNAGNYRLILKGKGNYRGEVRKNLYVADKQKLMKNASVTYEKTVKAESAEALSKGISQTGVRVKIGGREIAAENYEIDYAGTNRAVGTATMTLIGKNGYVGTKSVTFQITGETFSARTIDVRAYDSTKPSDPQTDAFRNTMPYTGRAVTQNRVILTTKVAQKELVYGEHYTIAYQNNVKKGNATMTFTALPASGYSGSFKKTFQITPQELTKERLTVLSQNGVTQAGAEVQTVYSKNGAKLSFTVTNEAGKVLREGVDYTVKYQNNSAVTTAQTADNKKPLLTVTGKGNYAGKVEVPFTIVQASLADALEQGIVTVSCTQVQKKDGMKVKDFKLKLMEGKKTLSVGETKDYVIDETKCTPGIIKAYADALADGTTLPAEPVVKVTGKGGYAGGQAAEQSIEIPLGRYLYADKLTTTCVYVIVSEGAGQSIYTGGQVTPDVAVYYGDKTAVNAAKKDKERDETTLTAPNGKYKLKKLIRKPSENAGVGDYTVSYGVNIAAGKNKGSVIVTGAGRYGGSVTVKFEIKKKAIY